MPMNQIYLVDNYQKKSNEVNEVNEVKIEERSTLKLVHKLCKMLEVEGIAYCHWKSNAALDRSASGDNDLDLLVSATDVQRFTEALYRLGFKQAQAPVEAQMPGVMDYYGYDEDADKVVHVHLHFRLILGHDRTKNYRLPIEEPFLASATQGKLFKVPTLEFEFIVFVIRMILKYSTWDVIISRDGTLPKSARQELAYLQPRVNWPQVYETLQQHLPYVDQALFDACVRSLGPDCPIWNRIKVGQQLHSKLYPYARRPQITDVCLKHWRRLGRGIRRRIFGNLPKRRLAHGGAMIAIVGGDGAGKSTVVEELYTWLSKDFDAIKVHLGRPPWSWRTTTVRGALKIGHLLPTLFKRGSSFRAGAGGNPPVFPGYSPLVWHVLAARDRYLAYVKGQRFATTGGLVICDRFPLPQIKLMDGPQLERIVDPTHRNRLINFLARLEKSYYPAIVPPELLIVLRVDPEIAVQRKTDEDTASVRRRCQEIWTVDWQRTRAHVIDACRPQAEVLSELKSLLWSEL